MPTVSIGALLHCVEAAAIVRPRGQRVLEVGARDWNGTVRPIVAAYGPREYVGVDLEAGPGVDEICRVEDLVARFGEGAFDYTIATELVEHVRDWPAAFRQLIAVTRPGGFVTITTRSHGFPYHGYPNDYWRYELADMERIFEGCRILRLESDRSAPGVGVTVQVDGAGRELPGLEAIGLHSMGLGRRATVDQVDTASLRWRVGITRAQFRDLLDAVHAAGWKSAHFMRRAGRVARD